MFVTDTGADTSKVVVHGLVAQPRSFTRDDLAALPQVTRSVSFVTRQNIREVTYTGPTLRDVILAAGGVVERQRLDRLRSYLVARSASGYTVVFSWGEIDALFGDGEFLVAHLSGGEAMAPTEGMARLVAPDDHHGARYVSQLVEVEVCGVDGPVQSPA